MKSVQRFTSESVSMGHPDKVADQISDAILDYFLEHDPDSRVACETMVSRNSVVVRGEYKTSMVNRPDFDKIVRDTIRSIGYTNDDLGFSANGVIIDERMDAQSPDIALGVNKGGAGDQGTMIGYACNETKDLMPMPIALAHKLMLQHEKLRRTSEFSWLGPDAKAQVTVQYRDGLPEKVLNVVFSTLHDPRITEEEVRTTVLLGIIDEAIPSNLLSKETEYFINPTGRFTKGGPAADTGLTGRKIIVDTYGGICPHGGGAFSGKDGTKVDRSAAYAARYLAKNIVAAELADRCTVRISYSIGIAEPVAIDIDTHDTGKVSEDLLEQTVRHCVDLTPAGIIHRFDLRRPQYLSTAAFGHFGRSQFPWEKLDLVNALLSRIDKIETQN